MKTRLALIVGLVAALPGMAGAQQALTFDAFASADADHNRVRKAGLSFDWSRIDNADYRGIRLEDAMFSPAGGDAEHSKRIYYRFADRRSDGTWSWKGMLGTDGHTWLGNASVVRESDWRQEFFLERAAVETARGIEERLHYTFAGAAFDLPVDERNVFTALAGVQDFSGRNLRQHLRARYIRVLSETHGDRVAAVDGGNERGGRVAACESEVPEQLGDRVGHPEPSSPAVAVAVSCALLLILVTRPVNVVSGKASISMTAPSRAILAAWLGTLYFRVGPTWIGAPIIIASGLVIVWREHHLARRAALSAQAATSA